MALACVAGAIALRGLFDPLLGSNPPLSTIFGCVAVAVWYGGWGPALLTVALSDIVANWLFVEPRFSVSYDSQEVWGLAA